MARSVPISRVRSNMLIITVLVMPTPPTSSASSAIITAKTWMYCTICA